MKKVTKLTAVLMAAMLVWLFASCSSEDSGSGSEPQSVTKPVYQFHSTVTYLAAGTDGTAGTEGTYVYFGDWPQTIKAQNVTVDETKSVTMGGAIYYLGSDGNYYVKCSENGFGYTNTYSDGTTVARKDANSEKYFKVEPIKWRVLNPDESGNKILLAENILTANVNYYDYETAARTIDGNTVYPNNYEHSKIRAYLNGLSYVKKENDSDEQTVESYYNGRGFLQTAFTAGAQSLIEVTKVDNSAASTNPASNPNEFNDGINEYVCEDTEDKIFLLSEKEITTSGYGFTEYEEEGVGNSRIREPSDYAKARNVRQDSEDGCVGCSWWLRSPDFSDECTQIINNTGNANYVGSVSGGFVSVVPALTISLEN